VTKPDVANLLLKHCLGAIYNPALILSRLRPVRVRLMRELALNYIEAPLVLTVGGQRARGLPRALPFVAELEVLSL
jgi:hypothetical protein